MRHRHDRGPGRWLLPPLWTVLAWLLMAGLAAAQSTERSAAPAAQSTEGSAASPSAAAPHQLRGGWYAWDPYQYRDYSQRVPILTGFDVEIERALARLLGVEISLPETAWQDHQHALAAGTADIAAGATENEARGAFAYFSKPYRTETDVLILPQGTSGRYSFRTIPGMLDSFARTKFRLGVIAGFVYADSRVNAFIGDPANRDAIVPVASDAQNLRNLLAGAIDGFLADRIAAMTTAWRRGESARIEEHPLHFSADIHFMLSRATQTPQTLARLDAAIDRLKQNGELHRIAQVYALPVLINQTLDRDWFRLLAFAGTVAFALSGVVLAYQGQYTLFGALALASLPAMGGGVVRDLLLQRSPIGIVRDPTPVLIVFATVLAGMLSIRLGTRLGGGRATAWLQAHAGLGTRLIELFDALGLAAFIVVGVVVVLDTPAQPLWLWGPVAAVITASFGGLIRDLFRNDRVTANLRGQFYPEIAAICGFALALFLEWEDERLQPDEIGLAVIVSVVAAFAMRMAAIRWRARGWRYG